jgi:hypothetical protein
MRVILIILAGVLLTSCDEYNSNSADKIRYGENTEEEVNSGDPNFAPAFAIIRTKCISCHSGDHNNWAAYTDDDKWIASGLVHRGDPDNSSFITRIINSGHPGANMPEGLGALPDSEFQILRKWISEMP